MSPLAGALWITWFLFPLIFTGLAATKATRSFCECIPQFLIMLVFLVFFCVCVRVCFDAVICVVLAFFPAASCMVSTFSTTSGCAHDCKVPREAPRWELCAVCLLVQRLTFLAMSAPSGNNVLFRSCRLGIALQKQNKVCTVSTGNTAEVKQASASSRLVHFTSTCQEVSWWCSSCCLPVNAGIKYFKWLQLHCANTKVCC